MQNHFSSMSQTFLHLFFRYRLAPEFHYPIPLEDSLRAAKYFLNNTHVFNVDPQRVAIVGKYFFVISTVL